MVKNKRVKLAALTLVLGTIVLGSAIKGWAEEGTTPKTLLGDFLKEKGLEVTMAGTVDFYDKYVWRGQYLDRDAVVQPGFSATVKGFTVGYWGSFPLESADPLNSSESDYYVSYAYTFDPVTLSVGHTWYQFPGTTTSSKEIFTSVSVATILTPTFSFMHDYEDGKDLNTDGSGNYYSLGLSYSLPIYEKYGISLELANTFGYVDGQWLSGQGWHITPTAGIKVPLTASSSITPTIGYNIPLGDLEDENIGNQEAKFFGGVKMAYAF